MERQLFRMHFVTYHATPGGLAALLTALLQQEFTSLCKTLQEADFKTTLSLTHRDLPNFLQNVLQLFISKFILKWNFNSMRIYNVCLNYCRFGVRVCFGFECK